MSCKIIAEIGINHNGDLKLTKQMIDVASLAGCDYVKFQKRNPDLCVPESQKSKLRKTPWGEMKYIDYKKKIEFGQKEYEEIFMYAREKNIDCFASVWDLDSVKFMKEFTDIVKIPSALITNLELCKSARDEFKTLIISTGMSTEEEIEKSISECNPDVVMHTNSTYPTPISDLNLKYIEWLKEKNPNREIGYSGHEYGLVPTFAATALGCSWIERHITLDRTMWGSDHMSSVEPIGLMKLVKGIRDIEKSLGTGGPREIYPSEKDKRKTLRGI